MTAWLIVLLYLLGGLVTARVLAHRELAAGGLITESTTQECMFSTAEFCRREHGGTHISSSINWPAVGGMAAGVSLVWPLVLIFLVTLVWRRPPTPAEAAAYRQRIAELERQLGIS